MSESNRRLDDPELEFLKRRLVSRQWAPFLAALAAELTAVADSGGTAAFMRATGARIARLHPLGGLETLEELEDQINIALTHMEWGWARLTAAEDHIVITHGACPNVLEHDVDQSWPPLMAEVLGGAYGAWLADQGSPGATTVCRDAMARPLVFEHRA
jgi:hypothetical protein